MEVEALVAVGTTRGEQSTRLSVIIPVYNEEENVQPLCDHLFKVLARLPYSFEVIAVNDGSKDRSLERPPRRDAQACGTEDRRFSP